MPLSTRSLGSSRLFHNIARQVKRASKPIDISRAHAWVAHWLRVEHTAHRRGAEGQLRAALSRIGHGDIESLFVCADGRVREVIDEDKFASEAGRLHVAHIMGDMLEELQTAACDEERSAIRARTHRRLARSMEPYAQQGSPDGGHGRERLVAGILQRSRRCGGGLLGPGFLRELRHFDSRCSAMFAICPEVRGRDPHGWVR